MIWRQLALGLGPINHGAESDFPEHLSRFRCESEFFPPRTRGSWTAEEWRPHRNVSKLRRPAISQTRGPPIKCKCLFMCLSVVADVYRCPDITALRLTYTYIANPANRITKGKFPLFFSLFFFFFLFLKGHETFTKIIQIFDRRTSVSGSFFSFSRFG